MHQSRHMWRTFKCFDVTLMKRNANCHCFDYIYRSIGKAEIKCYSASDAKGQNAFISLLKFYFIFSYRIKFCLLILVFLQHLASNEILSQPLEITIGRNCQCVCLRVIFLKNTKIMKLNVWKTGSVFHSRKLQDKMRYMVKENLLFFIFFK